jgi:crotonobetainyl-CoA:carnitine CoA-transferase CaiB-like acyl-CoA transferase
MQEGQARRLLCVPVNAVDDLVHDPQLAAREYFLHVPVSGEGSVAGEAEESGSLRERVYPGHPFSFIGVPEQPFTEAHPAGADNEAIFTNRLGLTPEQLATLQRDGVIGGSLA